MGVVVGGRGIVDVVATDAVGGVAVGVIGVQADGRAEGGWHSTMGYQTIAFASFAIGKHGLDL